MFRIKWQSWFSVVSLLASVGVGTFIPKWTRADFTVAEQIVISAVLWIVCLLVEVVTTVTIYEGKLTQHHQMWTIQHSGDEHLENIRANYYRLAQTAYGKKDPFIGHFMRTFEGLSRSIQEAAEKQEVRVVGQHLLTQENVLDAFSGAEERVLRYTWPIESTRLFTELPWCRYFETTSEMAAKKKIKIRAILIPQDEALLVKPTLQKLLDFFKTNHGMECRIATPEDYQTICLDHGVPVQYLDFGVYGDRLLFRTEQYTPETIGTFAKDPQVIRDYISLFDTMWNSAAVSRANRSQARDRVTFEELHDLDKESA